MEHEIYMAIIAVVSSSITSAITFFQTRKKYKSEVASSDIANLQNSLDLYKKVIDDMKQQLDEYHEMLEQNRAEIVTLKTSIQELLNLSCVDAVCKKRKHIPESEVKRHLQVK